MKSFKIQSLLLLLVIFASCPGIQARSLVLPVEAVEASKRMPADIFAEKYPGVDISGSIPDTEGYYVRYIHENLTYYFGPMDDYYDAMDLLQEMVEIREICIISRPELENSRIDIFQFSYDMLKKKKNRNADQQGGAQSGEMSQSSSVSRSDSSSASNSDESLDERGEELREGETIGGEGQTMSDDNSIIRLPNQGVGSQGQRQSQSQRQRQPSNRQSQSSNSSSSSSSSQPSSQSSPPVPMQQQQQNSSGVSIPWWDVLRLVFGF